MVHIVWQTQPVVPDGDGNSTHTHVNQWINQHWETWTDKQRVRHRLLFNAPSGALTVAFILNFSHPEGMPPTATVTRCVAAGDIIANTTIDPTAWYTLQVSTSTAGGNYQTIGTMTIGDALAGSSMLMGDPIPPGQPAPPISQFINLSFMFVPVDNNQYAIYICPNAFWDDGLVLTEGETPRKCVGPMTQLDFYTGSINQHYTVTENADGTISIKSVATQSDLCSFNMNGVDLGNITFGGDSFVLMTSASGGVRRRAGLECFSTGGRPVQRHLPEFPRAGLAAD